MDEESLGELSNMVQFNDLKEAVLVSVCVPYRIKSPKRAPLPNFVCSFITFENGSREMRFTPGVWTIL
jgi:hypothetical protein